MRLLAVLFLLGLPGRLLAQPGRADGLPAMPTRPDSQRAWLQRPTLPDTTRVLLLLALSRHHMTSNLDSARALAQEAVALARRRAYAFGQAWSLNTLAASYYYAADYPAAQRTFEQALRVAQRVGRPELIGHAYLGLGNVASELHNAAGVQQYYVQAQQAYAAARPRFVGGELLVLGNRANQYLNDQHPESASPLVRQALALLRQFPKAGRRAVFQNQLGQVQTRQQPDSAAATFRLAARQAHADHDGQTEGGAWLNLGELAVGRQRFAEALPYAQRAANLYRSLGDLRQLAEALDVQAQALAGLRRLEAYDTLRRYTTLRDTLLSQETTEAVATAQARFDLTEQQARVRELEQQRRIATLEATQVRFRSRVGLAALGGAALLLAGLGLWAYRRRQVARESALRARIAADLHDDVGSLLTQISLGTELLRDGLYTPDEQPQQLHRLADASRTAVRHMNDVVWGLDARHDSMADLLDRLRDHAAEVLTPTGLEAHFAVAPAVEASALPLPSRQALYLIYKEALHNVMKHAHGATQARVTLQRASGTLLLTVADNGQPAPTPRPGTGHGLTNMARRAAAAGGTLRSGPAEGGGWQVEARLPLE